MKVSELEIFVSRVSYQERAVHCVELLNYAGHSGCRSSCPRVFPRVASLPAIGLQLSRNIARGWSVGEIAVVSTALGVSPYC